VIGKDVVESERFLDNVASRLGRPRVVSPPERAVSGPPQAYLECPLGASAATDKVARFRSELELVGAKFESAASLAEVRTLLHAELAFWKAERLVSWATSEFGAWELDAFFRDFRCTSWIPSHDAAAHARFREAALRADVGITGVDRAIVNTGTLVLSANAARPRSVSLLPSVHLALVREDQLVDRMGTAFSAYVGASLASAVHFITGPSRTSDIENDLSIGVHGPAAVSVILWRNRS
jgi:L-lactate dehydrogenase complex protein LldG